MYVFVLYDPFEEDSCVFPTGFLLFYVLESAHQCYCVELTEIAFAMKLSMFNQSGERAVEKTKQLLIGRILPMAIWR